MVLKRLVKKTNKQAKHKTKNKKKKKFLSQKYERNHVHISNY